MRDTSLHHRLDPGRQQIWHARWVVWLFAIGTPLWVVVLVATTWSKLSGSQADPVASAAFLVVIWTIFLSLLIVPETWYLIRMWRGIPALQVDSWGLVWGDDWSRDLALEWGNIAAVSSRRLDNRYYSDWLLFLHSKDETVPLTTSVATRFMAWVNRQLYGTPYVLALRSLRIEPQEMVALLRRHYDGPMDLAAIDDAQRARR